MADFDPASYIAKNQGGFDPASYIAKHGGAPAAPMQAPQKSSDVQWGGPQASVGDRLADLFSGGNELGASLDKANELKANEDATPAGSKDKPIESDIFGSEKDRALAGFADKKHVGNILASKGYVDIDRNDNGDLVAKDAQGNWHKDATGLMSNPVNWAASGLGKSLPTAGGIAGGLAGSELGPGAIATAGIGGMAGEGARQSIGNALGVFDEPDIGEVGKEGVTMALGEGAGRYVLNPLARAAAPILGQGAKAIAENVGGGAASLGEGLTGVPQQEIKTYFNHAPEVDQLAQENDFNPERMAAKTKQKIVDAVNDYRGRANDQIKSAIEAAPDNKEIDVSSVIERLQAARDKLAQNPNMNKEAIKDIDELLTRVQDPMLKKNNIAVGYDAPNEKAATISNQIAAGGPQKTIQLHEFGEPVFMDEGEVPSDIPGQTGQRTVPVTEDSAGPNDPRWTAIDPETQEPGKKIDSTVEFPIGNQTLRNGEVSTGKPQFLSDLGGLNEIKKFLQDQAKPAYGSTPLGFKVGDAGANEAKGAAAVARQLMDQSSESSPEAQRIMDANSNLSKLHDIEDRVSRNVLDDDKSGAGLFAAGSGNNLHNANALQDLGSQVGQDFLTDAQKLAAARTFGRPQLLPKSGQGTTSTSRTLLGSGLGGLVGSLFGPAGAVAGGAIGGAATSPAALKLAIKAARGGVSVSQAVASEPWFQSIVKNPQLVNAIANPTMRKMVSDALREVGGDDDHHDDGVHYDPSDKPAQPTEVAKQQFLQGN